MSSTVGERKALAKSGVHNFSEAASTGEPSRSSTIPGFILIALGFIRAVGRRRQRRRPADRHIGLSWAVSEHITVLVRMNLNPNRADVYRERRHTHSEELQPSSSDV
jgi:hypothetical protein